MKVVQINSVYGQGSTGRIVENIDNLLKNTDIDSYVIYGRNKHKTNENVINLNKNIDIYLHVVKTRLLDQHGMGSRNTTHKIIKILEKIKPDIIHLHNIHGYYINIKILFKYLNKVDTHIIWTLHDSWAFTGHCAYFDFVGCRKWQSGCESCPEKHAYPKALLIDNSANNYQNKKELFNSLNKMILISPSKWLSNLVKKSFLQKYEVRIINNGVDLSVFKPSKSDFKSRYDIENKFVILGVASTWNRRKGLNYFLELNQLIDDNMTIVLVGLDRKQINNLPDNVIGIGKTDNVKELVSIYSNSDVFINPTLEDNFPTTNIESLACGTPVITFATGGSAEIIDYQTGRVTKSKTAKAIYEEIIKNYYLKKKPTELCVERVKKLYSSTEKYNEYLKLYRSLGEKT